MHLLLDTLIPDTSIVIWILKGILRHFLRVTLHLKS